MTRCNLPLIFPKAAFKKARLLDAPIRPSILAGVRFTETALFEPSATGTEISFTKKGQSSRNFPKATELSSLALSKEPENRNFRQSSSPKMTLENCFWSKLYRKTKGRLLPFFPLATPKANAFLSLINTSGKKSTFSTTSLNSALTPSSLSQFFLSCSNAIFICAGSN
ncbi:hypothetical protein ES707_07199 [subsurface metagenome]